MAEWLGIPHFFELSAQEAIAGFFTPLAVFLLFFLLQVALPARRIDGYFPDAETGRPRQYRLNGLLVFLIAHILWIFELTGMSQDWFYRSTIYAVAGGTVFAAIFTLIAVYSPPKTENREPIRELWSGRVRDMSLCSQRFDIKMYLYVVGGTMVSLNALSGAVWHYQEFAQEANPGLFLFTALFSFYVLDYFIFERVQLYTFDMRHEGLGFKLIWGGLIVYGWMYTMPLWGLAAHPNPGFSPVWTVLWLAGSAVLFLVGWSISRLSSLQKYTFKRWPERRFLGFIEPKVIDAGDRRILCSGFWGVARHVGYLGEAMMAIAVVLMFGYPGNAWAWTYFIFINSLMIWRQIEDDRQCALKYGAENWNEYQKKVKFRIIPGVY